MEKFKTLKNENIKEMTFKNQKQIKLKISLSV